MMFFKKWWVALAVFLVTGRSVLAFTASDADTILSAYNTAFYTSNTSGHGYFKDTTAGGQTYFWGQAEEIEAVLDCYDRTAAAGTKTQIAQLCNGFVDNNGSDWSWNEYNDDICWAVIAFSRAYQATGNTTFRNLAKFNYDMMYARGWDTNFTGGGIWWRMDKGGKNACIAGPAAVAACYLYSIYGDVAYLNKARDCYAWERRVLFQANSGAIYDSIAINNTYNTWASTYNQGTFIGAGNFLYRATGLPYYYQDAMLAARYAQNNICSAGIFPEYGSGDLGGFNGILARWMGKFTRDQNLGVAFTPWLNANGIAAWSVRNANNLSWQKWKTPTPGGTNILSSFDCSDSVVIMQVGLTNSPDPLLITPDVGFVATVERAHLPEATSLDLVLTNTGAATINWTLVESVAWLSASATSGSLAAGAPAVSVQLSLIPAAVTNLAAGRYYTSVWITNQVTHVAQSRTFLLIVSGGNAPVALTGWNAAIIAPNTASSGHLGATAFDVPNNYCFFQAGLSSGSRGLPPDGAFTSLVDGTTVFQFQPYGGTNAVVVGYTRPASVTLTLATPAAYDSLAFLACSANTVSGGGTATCVLNFTNGTHSPVLTINAPDWFSGTANAAISATGRLKMTTLNPEDNGSSNPNLYQTTLNLAALGLNQPIASITLGKSAAAGGQQDTAIFAVSGTTMPAAANIVQQPQSVTNSVPTQGANFTVLASGVPPLNYQWYYSASGTPGSFAPLAAETNSALQLAAELPPEAAGSYQVVVTNDYGAVTSAVATLTVYRAPVITRQPGPADQYRFVGTNTSWSVAVAAATPVTYYWYCGDVALPGNTTLYTRYNLQVTNSGDYSVVVSNAYGVVTSSIAALTVVTAPTYPLGQRVVTDHALGYWRLDETSGTVARDYVAGNNGTYTPKVLLGQPGNKLLDTHRVPRFGSLATSNSCVTNIAVDFSTTGNATFSVEAWVNGGSQTSDAGLVTKGYGSGGEQFNLDCGGGSHAFRFFVRDAGGTAHLATGTVTPNNQWHHLVGVCDEVNGYVRLFVDGTKVAETTVGPYLGILSSSVPMSIGSRQASAGSAYNNQFAGYIEEVAVYGYALSSNQVVAHYQAATNRAPVFASNPLVLAAAPAGQLFSTGLVASVTDPNGDAITYSKLSGPAWLTLSANGYLSGTPLSSDVGANSLVVKATDAGGLASSATVSLQVLAAPPLVLSATWQAPELQLNWTGGIGPYQVQTTVNLADPQWQDWGAPVSGFGVTIAPTNAAALFRVSGQ